MKSTGPIVEHEGLVMHRRPKAETSYPVAGSITPLMWCAQLNQVKVAMEISEGGQASQEFLRITYTDVTKEERKQVRNALELYCKQDTEGLVEMLDALQSIAKNIATDEHG